MNQENRKTLENSGLVSVLVFAALALLAGSAGAQVQYLGDGAIPNAAGGWDLPAQGTCPADLTQTTRPDCVALRLNIAPASCVAPNYSLTTGGVCNDLINTTQVACEAQPDRKWNSGTGVCAIVMMDDDRNNVTCAMHQGTWVTSSTCIGVWVMPLGTAYTPNLLTGTGPGDQCLRCHNARTQYNGPRVRDTEDTIYMGHKNMSRKVTVTMPWGGPPFHCTGAVADTEEDCFNAGGVWDPTIYPGTDTGQNFDWVNGTVDIDLGPGVNARQLYWIYADWLSAYPRAIYHDDADTSTTPDKPKVSYSCARCHTTGWTADATLKVNKKPHADLVSQAPLGSNPVSGTPSIVWDGVSDAVAGQVNLAPGAPFTEKMASWDYWGISCTRCHGSAVADTGAPPRPAPAGMSSHHSNLTGPDAGSGYCSNPNWSNLAACNTSGGAWLTACSEAGVCSNLAFTTSGTCVAGGSTWTVWDTQALCLAAGKTWGGTGCIGDATKTTQAACETAGQVWYGSRCSVNTFTSQSTCEAANAVWSNDQCSIGGVCNNPIFSDAVSCRAAGAQWATATDIIRCEDGGGHYTGTKPQRGQVITGLCMNCHRQETNGAPYDSTNPATALKVGPYHGSVGFVSHPHANQFLNSPHGKFTGTFAQVQTGKFNYAMTGEYKSFFMTEAEAGNTGNGCTGCHEVHTSVVAGEEPFREECTECHAKDLNNMIHPVGEGTPMEEMATDPMEACVTCHMPAGEHLFRINTSAAYSTKPAGALTATVNANVAPDGNYPNAVWIDLDSACGKCHGGGVANVETTGSITGGAKLLTVAAGQGASFTVGQRVEIAGAGGIYYDEEGTSTLNNDFESYIVSIAGDVLTLAGNATKSVTNAAVEQNPVKNGAAYFDKATLAVKAKGIHNDKPYVTFGYTLSKPNPLQVNVDASFSSCSGDIANCDAFVWNWGDASPEQNLSVPTASHVFPAGGTYVITLTVHEYGVNEGSKSKSVRVYAADALPAAGGTACASIINPNTWTASLTDNSTDDLGVRQVTVNWGDGGAISSVIDPTPPYTLVGTVFTHTYLNVGMVTIKQTAYDTIGQANLRTCPPVTLAGFSIAGTVYRSNGTTPVASATVTLRKGTTTRTFYTNSLGVYTATNLKPGSWSVTVTKAGYDFGVAPQVPAVVIGPSVTAINVNAVTP